MSIFSQSISQQLFRRPSLFRSRAAAFAALCIAATLLTSCGSGETASGGTPAAKIPAPPDVAAPPPGSLKTTSGLSTRVLQAGTGTRHPGRGDRVTVHYTGWTTDGEMFDSSVARGEPAQFGVTGVIPGWTQGLLMMVEGEKRRFWIPGSLAYDGQPGRPQGTLVFDVELIKIN